MSSDNQPKNATSDTPGKRINGKILKAWAKAIIAIMVAAGLIWAGKSALQQWQSHNEKLQLEIAQIDREIKTGVDPQQLSKLQQKRRQLQKSVPTLSNLRWDRIGFSMLLYAIGMFVPGMVLHSALRSLGENPRHRTAIAAQLLGHAGKYVPGKAMVIVLRATGLAVDGVAPVRATISVFMETLLMMAVGATVACAVIFWLPVPPWMTWSALGVAILASIPTIPPILKFVAARVSNTDDSDLNATVDRTDSHQDSVAATSSLRFFVTGWAWSLTSWLLIGMSFTSLVAAIPSIASETPNALTLFAVSTAAMALAVVIGFASLLPGGAGIRELVLTTILATTISSAHAFLAALAARLMFIFVEAICAGAAWMWLQRQGNDQTNGTLRP